MPSSCRKEQVDLASLSSTCRAVYQCARPLLWHNVHVVFDQKDFHDEHILHKLQSLLSTPNHPLFTATRHIRIVVPYWTVTTRNDFAKELDLALGTLINRAACLQQIFIDLAMIDDPDVRFQESLKSIFRHERIVSVSLHGYAGNRTVNTQITRLAVSHLRLEQIGKSLALDLYCFHHLKRLHLTTDCRDETLPDPKHWHIPPALWATLETFVLEIYGWQPHAEVVVQAVADSVKVCLQDGRMAH